MRTSDHTHRTWNAASSSSATTTFAERVERARRSQAQGAVRSGRSRQGLHSAGRGGAVDVPDAPWVRVVEGRKGALRAESSADAPSDGAQGRAGLPLFDAARQRLRRIDPSPLFRIPHVQAVAIVLVVVMCGLIVYPAARDNYITQRNNERLAAELTAVQTRNDQLSSQVEALSTDEGVEDAARELGWTKEGEEAMVVRGMDPDETLALPETVTTASISAPSHWYTPLLDFLFHADTTTPLLVDSYTGDVTGGAARVTATGAESAGAGSGGSDS